MTLQEGPADTDVYTNNDTALTVRNGQPFSVTVRTTPYTTHERLVADLGVYAQDTWTIKRLTVNAGLRWDYLNNKFGAQYSPGRSWNGPPHRRFPTHPHCGPTAPSPRPPTPLSSIPTR